MIHRTLVAALLSLSSGAAGQILLGPQIQTVWPGFFAPPLIAMGDLDADGFDDMVVGHLAAPGLRLGDGAGHFGPEVPIAPLTAGGTVELADLNGDGLLDLINGSSQVQRFFVSLGTGGGGFAAPAVFLVSSPAAAVPNFLVLRTGDADGDGDIDVVSVAKGGMSLGSGPGEVRLYANDGAGALSLASYVTQAIGTLQVQDAFPLNVNDDAAPDLAVVFSNTLSMLLPQQSVVMVGDGQGSATTVWFSQTEVPEVAGDLDGDGDDDFLARLQSPPPGPASGKLRAHLNNGAGVFSEGPQTSTFPASSAAVGGLCDFDGDTVLDLLLLAPAAELWVLRGSGDGSFTSGPHVSLSSTSFAAHAELADVDGDGRPDVITEVGSGSFNPFHAASLNRTYAAGGPALDLGQQLEGAQWPIQVASGSFAAGTPFSFALAGAVPSGAAFHVVGVSALNAPFKGGTMVPAPLLINGPFPVNAQGELLLAGTWAGAPSGATILLQFWLADVQGPKGFAASSGVQLVMP